MAQTKFEGDVSDLSSRQIEFISEILTKNGFPDNKVIIKPVGEAGDNYTSNVIRITAEKDGETLKIIGKVAPKIPQLRMAMKTRNLFFNEHIMYTEVLPKFTELEKAAGIPKHERLRYAACYGNLMEDCDELILLEDLTVSDYVMLDRFKPLTNVEIRIVLKSFARLHSLSYALKNQQPDIFNDLKSKLFDMWYDNFMLGQMEALLNVFEKECSAVCDPKYKDVIIGTGKRMFDSRLSLRDFDEDSRFSVIQQGDAWTNNILFQSDEGKPVSCCMIDYQISKVNSPVADLHYMIFNCTDHETRKRHFYDWLDYYHTELGYRLNELGLKVNNVYPRDQLDADLKRHGKFCIGLAFIVTSAVSREAASAKKLKEAMENITADNSKSRAATFMTLESLDEKTVNTIKTKIEGIMESSLYFGF